MSIYTVQDVFQQNGVLVEDLRRTSAILPFTIVEGNIYELSVSMVGIYGTSDWLGLGFADNINFTGGAQNDANSFRFADTGAGGWIAGYAWMFASDVPSQEAFDGPGINNQVTSLIGYTQSTTVDLKTVLDASGSTDWTVSYYVDDVLFGQSTKTKSLFDNVDSVGLSVGNAGGTFSDFSLVTLNGVVDDTPPTVTSLSPADDSIGVKPRQDLVVTFNESIQVGSGIITITNLDAMTSTVIPVGDAQISISGSSLTINPTNSLTTNANYAVLVDAGAVQDLSANAFAGITNATTWNFTIAASDPFATGFTRVFLLAGQSNMKGQGVSSELTAPYDAVQTNVLYWDNGTWADLAPIYGNSTGEFGPELTFGYTVKQALPDDNIVLIKFAANGTALYNDWATGTGPEYITFTNTVHEALADLEAAGADYEISGMLWLQGESDANEGQGASYETNLRDFIADMRAQFAHPGLPLYIARITTFYGSATQSAYVRDAQVAIADSTFNVEWFDTDMHSLHNGGHYDTDGQIAIGIDYANTYLTNDLVTTNWPALRIMVIGDSITCGYTDNPTWATEPFNFGYRSMLYKLLQEAQYDAQFIGTSPEPWDLTSGDPTLGGTVSPEFDLRLLGQDGHEGYGGKRIAYIDGIMADRIAVNQPDLILLNIGMNNVRDTTTAGEMPAIETALSKLVGTVFATDPDVQLIVGQINPRWPVQPLIVDYNTYIRETLVPAFAATGANISTVDNYPLFLTNTNDLLSVDQATLSNGINHPTNEKYDQMAANWFEGITGIEFVNPTNPPIPAYNYTEDFDGGATNLNGKTSTTGNGVWSANSCVTADGNTTGGAGAAILPIELDTNRTYTVSIDVNYLTAFDGWIGVGFSSAASVSNPDGSSASDRFSNANVPGYAWIIYTETDTISAFEGERTNGSDPVVDYLSTDGLHTLTVVLDTTGKGSTFTADFLLDGTSMLGDVPTTINHPISIINSVGFTVNCDAGNVVDNFSLVTDGGLTEFETWAAGFGLFGADAASTNDYDNDGIINLLEYAFNGNPTNGWFDGTLPVLGQTFADGGTNWIEYVYVERATADPGINYTLLASGSLTNAFTNSNDAVFGGEGQVGDYKTITNWIPTEGKSAEFLQMQVEEE